MCLTVREWEAEAKIGREKGIKVGRTEGIKEDVIRQII